ncbi:MAG: hypothetical protein ACNI27_08090 [Desulfovibrio sp.]
MRFRNIFIVVVLMFILASCGYKDWPQPVESQDVVSIVNAQASLDSSCMGLKVQLGGQYQNVKAVDLLLEPVGYGENEGCPTCPFKPLRRLRLVPGDAGFEQNGPFLNLTYCGLKTDKTYRWRVVVENVHQALRPVRSDVKTIEP